MEDHTQFSLPLRTHTLSIIREKCEDMFHVLANNIDSIDEWYMMKNCLCAMANIIDTQFEDQPRRLFDPLKMMVDASEWYEICITNTTRMCQEDDLLSHNKEPTVPMDQDMNNDESYSCAWFKPWVNVYCPTLFADQDLYHVFFECIRHPHVHRFVLWLLHGGQFKNQWLNEIHDQHRHGIHPGVKIDTVSSMENNDPADLYKQHTLGYDYFSFWTADNVVDVECALRLLNMPHLLDTFYLFLKRYRPNLIKFSDYNVHHTRLSDAYARLGMTMNPKGVPATHLCLSYASDLNMNSMLSLSLSHCY